MSGEETVHLGCAVFTELGHDLVAGLAEDNGGGLTEGAGGSEEFESGLADARRGGLGENEDFRHDVSPDSVCRARGELAGRRGECPG